ncbi:histidine phosphatase family protein [archaeon]|nr:histidine phosphatase family protein [archaeon]
MQKILIIRHASTDWEKMGYLGHTDIGLSEKGLKQAETLSKTLFKEHIGIVFTSNLLRAYQTADIISKKLGIPLKEDKRLCEVNFGVFEGLTREEAREKFSYQFEKRELDKWNFASEEGESYKDAGSRLLEFMHELQEKPFENVIIVTHATLIKIFLILFAEIMLKDAEKILIEPCSCFEFDFNKNGVVVSWKKLS